MNVPGRPPPRPDPSRPASTPGSLHSWPGETRDPAAYKQLLARLGSFSQTVATAPDVTAVYRGLREFVCAFAPCDALYVSLTEPLAGGRRGVFAWSDGCEQDVAARPACAWAENAARCAMQTGEVVVTEDVAGTGGPAARPRAGEEGTARPVRSAIAVPIHVLGRTLGVFEIQSATAFACTEEHVTALRMAASLAAIAIDNVLMLERERAQRRAAETERENYRLLFRSNPRPMWVFEQGTLRFLAVNDAALRRYGYTEAEFLSFTLRDIRPPEDVPQLLAAFADPHHAQPWRARHRLKSGEILEVEIWSDGIAFEGRHARLAVADDVTARVRADRARQAAEEKLRQSENLLRIAGRTARVGAWAVDLPALRALWSDETCTILGMPAGTSLTLKRAMTFCAPEWRRRVRRAFTECARDGTPFELEVEAVTADGTRIWVHALGEAARDPDGRIRRVQGALQDLTARKHAEEKVREQAALLDHARDGIVVRDLEQRVAYWNRAAERLYGWTASEALGRRFDELLRCEAQPFRAAFEHLLRAGEWTGELQKTARNGNVLTLESRWTLLRDAAGVPKCLLAIDTDITDRKKLEAQFLRAQRLESIGTLAGGIAHDLNNLLAPIAMSVDLLKLETPSAEAQHLLEIIERSTKRSASLVRQVLSFARGVEGARVAVCLRNVVQEVATMIENTFPKNIHCETCVPAATWPVTGDPTQIQQVLLNLCVNARDAMPDGGRLQIRARNERVDAGSRAAHRGVRPGDFVVLEVQDNGCGIPAAAIDRIFEPFFTTKAVGKGSGLGLATTLGIVRSHKGLVEVDSTVGRGSTFQVYLPARVENPAPPARRAAAAPSPRGQGELLLVVDDEAAILTVTRQILEAYGYRVLTADNGGEAVRLVETRGPEVALVIMDLMMPAMDGPTAALAMRRVRPNLRIVGASGMDASMHAAAKAAGMTRLLRKPYSTSEMLALIRAMLAA